MSKKEQKEEGKAIWTTEKSKKTLAISCLALLIYALPFIEAFLPTESNKVIVSEEIYLRDRASRNENFEDLVHYFNNSETVSVESKKRFNEYLIKKEEASSSFTSYKKAKKDNSFMGFYSIKNFFHNVGNYFIILLLSIFTFTVSISSGKLLVLKKYIRLISLSGMVVSVFGGMWIFASSQELSLSYYMIFGTIACTLVVYSIMNVVAKVYEAREKHKKEVKEFTTTATSFIDEIKESKEYRAIYEE